jgi:hypothetical protein
MSNYQEGSAPAPEGGSGSGGGSYQESGHYPEGSGYQGGPGYQGGSSAYQGGGPPYQGGYQGETSPYQGPGQQQWPGGPGTQGGGPGYFPGGGRGGSRGGQGLNIRSTFTSTEFWSYVVVALGILIAAAVTDDGVDGQGFGAAEAWRYVTWLTIGYLISRGLTKFGGHERGRDSSHDHDHDGH